LVFDGDFEELFELLLLEGVLFSNVIVGGAFTFKTLLFKVVNDSFNEFLLKLLINSLLVFIGIY
jgi:hypothetical protein